MQHEHAHLGARVARGERLAVRPDAEDGVGGPRVVLGDDGDLHDHASSTWAASLARDVLAAGEERVGLGDAAACG